MIAIKISKIAELTGNKYWPSQKDRNITSLCYDSRKAVAGSAFFCIAGAISDGHDYAMSAYERGCRVFICERMPRGFPLRGAKVFIAQQGVRAALADIAAEFYGHPEKEMRLIGITGTKGKTTTAHFVASILNKSGIKTGYIGTNGVDFDNCHYDTLNTTPESCDLYEYLAMMLSKKVKTAVIEVSSQALMLGRVRNIVFDTCVFTNLYLDHIGGVEHPTFENYRECKMLLFSQHCGRYALINADSPESDSFAAVTSSHVKKVIYSTERPTDIYSENASLTRGENGPGTKFSLCHKGDSCSVELGLPGLFNISNALAAASVCLIYGVPLEKIADAISDTKISGRFETVHINGVDFIIDYAHNGESLRSVLSVLRCYEPNRLICLFGSVGGRTQMRRAELGSVASELADYSIITSDNPDCEPPTQIIDEIAEQYKHPYNYIKITDRREAILHAISIAKAGDIVLLAGKGHESYQLICGKRVPFSEREILQTAKELSLI